MFFEDFSAVATGNTPGNWNTERSSSGERVSVAEISGAPGKWLKLKKTATPKVAVAASGDFDISFDLLVQKGDVPWGTPGIQLQTKFATGEGEKQYNLDISPGDMNRADAAGWLILNIAAPSCNIGNYHSLPDFTGSKAVNKVTMTLRKKGSSMSVLCNNKKIWDCSTAFPAGANLKSFNFYVNDKNVYYVGNILLKKTGE